MQIPESHTTPAKDGGYPCDLCSKEHPRITQILDQCVPKFALVPWAYKVGLRGGDIEAEKIAGGNRGTELHEYLGEYITSGKLPPITSLREECVPFGHQLGKFITDYEPEFLASEVPIVHHDMDYAGTLDGFAIIHRQPPRRNKPVDLEGKRVLFDLKTSRDGRVYAPAHFLQVAAYREAWDDMNGTDATVDYEIIVAVGEEKYQVAVNYFAPMESTSTLMGFYSMLQRAKLNNPNRRENHDSRG